MTFERARVRQRPVARRRADGPARAWGVQPQPPTAASSPTSADASDLGSEASSNAPGSGAVESGTTGSVVDATAMFVTREDVVATLQRHPAQQRSGAGASLTQRMDRSAGAHLGTPRSVHTHRSPDWKRPGEVGAVPVDRSAAGNADAPVAPVTGRRSADQLGTRSEGILPGEYVATGRSGAAPMGSPSGRQASRPIDRSADADPRVAARVDPRIEARRRMVTAQQLRLSLRPWMFGAALAVVVCAIIGALLSPLFSAKHLEITGVSPANTPRIEALLAASEGRPMIRIDVAELQKRVATDPIVAAATVQRVWPRTLRVRVVERTPVAVLRFVDGTESVADAKGNLLGTPNEAAAGLVRVRALSDAARPLGQTDLDRLSVIGALDPALRTRVSSVDSAANNVTARVTTGAKRDLLVTFGTVEELDLKAAALRSLLSDSTAATLAAIDLSVPDAPVLTPRA